MAEVPQVEEEARKPKGLTDFEKQNAASKRLVDEVDKAMRIMLDSMVKEIRAVLDPQGK